MINHVFFTPHPPLAVHSIGQGNERRIQATLDGYERIAKEIKEIKPETIIFLSPHGKGFRDALAVIQEVKVSGNFAMFGYEGIGTSKDVNSWLTEELIRGLNEANVTTVSLSSETARKYNIDIGLDHGVLVPMHFIDLYYSQYTIVHITTGFMPPEVHFKAGQVLQSIVSHYDQKVVVVASGDLSHALKEEGPYNYNAFGQVFDERVQEAIKSGDVGLLLSLTSGEIEAAAQCGLGSFCMGFGILDGKIIKGQVYSYEGPFGVGYLTGKLTGE